MKKKKLLYWSAVVILLAVFLTSGSFVVRYAFDALQQKNEYDRLAAVVEQSRHDASQETGFLPAQTVPEESAAETVHPPEPSILPEYMPVYEENSDLVGWMTIDGTPIHYPVMQTPDRVDFYLDHNFSKQPNAHGCLYVRETCDVFAPSDNVTVYGHHMKDGSMFAGLDNFLSQSFWEEYRTVKFDTLYEHRTYTVFAVFTTTATVSKGFAYHQFENARDAEEFDAFISTCIELSQIDTGITPQYGDKIICLSTCEYSHDNGRLVVAAVMDTDEPIKN